MNDIKEFFTDAFADMKASAQEQHEVDKANFAAIKAESKASFAEYKAMSNPEYLKAAMTSERNAQIK